MKSTPSCQLGVLSAVLQVSAPLRRYVVTLVCLALAKPSVVLLDSLTVYTLSTRNTVADLCRVAGLSPTIDINDRL